MNQQEKAVSEKFPIYRNKLLAGGVFLLKLFLAATIAEIVFILFYLLFLQPDTPGGFARFAGYTVVLLLAVLLDFFLFWSGIICVYATSVQLGLKWRIIGIACGWIPFVNIWALCRIITMTSREAAFEKEKYLLDQVRAESRLCETKYPLLLVHGVFFRDFRFFNYWGRIPYALKQNGAMICYGSQQSAASVADCGQELTERIRAIVQETGCEKVNIIAHSKGGLDSRYAISACGAAPYVASLTTINTPHRGCIFADYLLEKIPEKVQKSVARKYNAALKKFGDSAPDFLAAVRDLTASACALRNEKLPDSPEVYYQSVGSKMNCASSGRFPLNMAYPLVKHFDGANDGLVSMESARWGEHFTELTTSEGRGISHGDMIDLNRENIAGFDVQEFYVNLIAGLKKRGY
ncbi:MAG: triacylglycerol lipase [Bacteroidales bacterium]|nr:triacylglycerol lipase [Bacteroidales bacterium]MCM1414904.1 triacylglycerol lipase [bacterium]MCM1423945.1 triacylglycerol lipase [bacterium]